MQTLKIEMAVVGGALFVLGGFVAMQGAQASPPEVAGVEQFTAHDFAAFDRHFEIDGQACAVGLALHRLCLGRSPLEDGLKIGDRLSPEVPILAAEFRVIVETDLKAESLRTVRFGQTLVLIDPETRTIRDLLHLAAPDFAAARGTPAPA